MYVLAEYTWDWYKLQLENETAEKRTLTLSEDRDRSVIIKAHLEPGASIQHTVDVNAWASRPINGARTLAAGTYRLTVTYTVPPKRVSGADDLKLALYPLASSKEVWVTSSHEGHGLGPHQEMLQSTRVQSTEHLKHSRGSCS